MGNHSVFLPQENKDLDAHKVVKHVNQLEDQIDAILRMLYTI